MRKLMMICLLVMILPVLPARAQDDPEIVTFDYDGTPLIYEDVEQGIAAADFSWEAVNVRSPYRMQMHALVGGSWMLIGENFDPVKSDRLVIAHPLSFSVPIYRLSIVDANNDMVDDAYLYLSYAAEDPDGRAEITQFATPQDRVSRQALVNGGAMIPVSWAVENRTAGTNLIFEQVLPDGMLQSVELPRQESWIRSVGQGVVAPVNVPGQDHLTLQIRLVNISTGETLDTRQMAVTINDAAISPTPTAVATPVPEPVSNRIQLNVPPLVTLGSRLTLSWDADIPESVADEVVIREWHQVGFTGVYREIPIYFEDDSGVPVNEWRGLPLSGEITTEAPANFPPSTQPDQNYQNVIIYVLYLYQDGEPVYEDERLVYTYRPMYLRTEVDATACVPTMELPEQAMVNETFTISWDLCGVPFVHIDYTTDDGPVFGLHPRFTPGNPGNHAFSIALSGGLSEGEFTFTITSYYSNARVEDTIRIIQP